MTHTYNITGMTCTGCVPKVRSELLKLGNVISADVQLQAPQATITMQKHITVKTLQEAVSKAGKYTIEESDEKRAMQPSDGAAGEQRNSYFPIFLIFGYITAISLLVQLNANRFDFMKWMGHFMAGFFLVFSFFKIMNLKGFAEGYSMYDIIARRTGGYGYIYPFIELGLGIAFITGFNLLLTNVTTAIVMTVSTIGVAQNLMKKSPFQCACLGTIIKLPLSKVTLFEDVLMLVMSVIMIINLV